MPFSFQPKAVAAMVTLALTRLKSQFLFMKAKGKRSWDAMALKGQLVVDSSPVKSAALVFCKTPVK